MRTKVDFVCRWCLGSRLGYQTLEKVCYTETNNKVHKKFNNLSGYTCLDCQMLLDNDQLKELDLDNE